MADHRKHVYVGRGAAGVKGTKKLRSEITGMLSKGQRSRRVKKPADRNRALALYKQIVQIALRHMGKK